MLGDLLIAIGLWLAYFSVIFFPLRWVYDRVIGPRPSDRMADRDRLSAWTARQARLRRIFVSAGIGLAVIPLLFLIGRAIVRSMSGG
jgi:hypothetical protein